MASAADEFLKLVVRSGLLSKSAVQAAMDNLPGAKDQEPAAVADHFVKLGLLTQFQATKLLQGAAVGLTLGPYKILTPIGKGGMGMVYLGIDQRVQHHVAVKVLSPQKLREGNRHLQRFNREIEISKGLIHPHLVLAQDTSITHGVHYLVMEYVPGVTLYRLVMNEGPLDVPRAAHLFSEVASALEYAHGQGLIHRDLKPANIMVTPNEHAKVLDLGLAMMMGETVEDAEVVGGKGHVVGTFDYIAPEQTRDASKVDGRADIYSLGCSIYFALTGRPPFPTGNPKEKIQAQRHQEPEPIAKLNPMVPEGFTALVRKMMAKSPDERLGSMTAVRASLLAWASGAPERPLDKVDDTAFHAAIAALQSAPVPAEDLEEAFAFVNRPGERTEPASSQVAAPSDRRRQFLLAGVIGVWTLVFALIVMIFLLR